jgi:hypothetical protein
MRGTNPLKEAIVVLQAGTSDQRLSVDDQQTMAKIARALAAATPAVIIWRGSHDLSAPVRQADQTAEYIRVATRVTWKPRGQRKVTGEPTSRAVDRKAVIW